MGRPEASPSTSLAYISSAIAASLRKLDTRHYAGATIHSSYLHCFACFSILYFADRPNLPPLTFRSGTHSSRWAAACPAQLRGVGPSPTATGCGAQLCHWLWFRRSRGLRCAKLACRLGQAPLCGLVMPAYRPPSPQNMCCLAGPVGQVCSPPNPAPLPHHAVLTGAPFSQQAAAIPCPIAPPAALQGEALRMQVDTKVDCVPRQQG